MNNLPPGVSEYTEDAPWNQNTKEVLVNACISKYISVPDDITEEELEEIKLQEMHFLEYDLKDSDYEIEYLSIENN